MKYDELQKSIERKFEYVEKLVAIFFRSDDQKECGVLQVEKIMDYFFMDIQMIIKVKLWEHFNLILEECQKKEFYYV